MRVELPLALPAIIAGLRIATVSTISIATVAAFVIPKGLGRPIFIALQQDIFKTEILAAGGLAVALALFADGLLALVQRALTPWARLPGRWRCIPAGNVRRRLPLHRRPPHLLLDKAGEHLELSGAALGIALVLALPLGLWLGHRHRGFLFAASVSNVGRALPSLVLIAFGLTILGIGFWNNTAALVVLAVPPILTNAYFAIDGVDRDVVEAARGMG